MLFGKSKRKTLLLFLHRRICLLQNRNRFLDNPPFYSVTVWLCLPRYHKYDLKFHFFFSYIWPIIVSITLRSYCVIYKGLLSTLLTLSWIKLEFGKILPTLTRRSFMYLYVITCAVPSVSQVPRFTRAVVGSFGGVTNRIRTAIVSYSFTLIDVWNHIQQWGKA